MKYAFTKDHRHRIKQIISVIKTEHTKNAVKLWLSDIKDEVSESQLYSLRQLIKDDPAKEEIKECIKEVMK
jgi:hypothetical protein